MEQELNPSNAEEYLKLGLFYHNNGDYDRAIADYTEALRIDPNKAAVCFYGCGRAYQEKKDYDKAIGDFEMAVKLDPDEDDYREYLERAEAARERRK